MNGPIVVVGDTLLDIDLEGSVGRICPDAPVPVVGDLVEHPRPGGAGLAATLAARDGAEVVLVTALSDDEAGDRLTQLLDGVRVVPLPYDGPTPVKQRVRAAGQSLLRLDSGDGPGTVGPLPAGLQDLLTELLRSAAVVLVADYGRGVTGQAQLRETVAGLPHNIPVVWDPHPRGARPVPAARLVCPNREEATVLAEREGVQGAPGLGGFAQVGRQAAGLVAAWQAQAVAITLGERGALLSYGTGSPVVTPAPRVPCVDVCGAGDRFAVTAALSLGAGAVTTEAVQNAVWSAADFVSGGGAGSVQSQPQPERTRAAGGTVVATGGCFDLLHAGHVATLRAARDLGDCLVVCLNSDDSVRRLKGPGRPLVPAADRARVLAALEYVDEVVVFDEDTPVEVLRRIHPDVWAKGGDYALTDLEEAAVLEEWGGQAVVLPYLQGRSTTQMVASARADR
jgi:D-beta-D-heptose 7-phosphate kinase / D-beta-D-heptose 1-phosphate adenosyltransferase